jgi:predicted AlkP superfamily pyrophosphatase or phosphodiesterase
MKKTLSGVLILMIIAAAALISFSNAGCSGKKGVNSDNAEENTEIRLVLTVVVDMLRADIVSRLKDRFGKGGFRYLMEKGIWYKNARYRHCTTLTAVGHATLFTGAVPAEHGILGNYWYDHNKGKNGGEVSSVEGQTPRQLTSTTIGDELVLATGKRSRVFGVSLKDRGAILPSGYLGKAFWYNRENGTFRTNPDFYKGTPDWCEEWNALKKADEYRNKKWELLHDKNTYIYGNSDDREVEYQYNQVRGAVFPHSLSNFKGDSFYKQICVTPFGDELTLDFLFHLVDAEKVGKGDSTDMLSVSFSVTDVIGHCYGPNSLEYEDNVLRVDALLAKLFAFIDSRVGLDKTLIVFASDHGVDLIPEYRVELGMKAGRVIPGDMEMLIENALQTRYKTNRKFFICFRNPSVYLDTRVISDLKLDIREVESVAVEALMKMPGIAFAVSRSDLMEGKYRSLSAVKRLEAAFHPKRSGNVLIVQEPFYFMYHIITADSAMHGAPYSYDNHVPLFFSGPGIKHGTVYRAVNPSDIAPTIALKLGIEEPSGCSGKPLLEVFK